MTYSGGQRSAGRAQQPRNPFAGIGAAFQRLADQDRQRGGGWKPAFSDPSRNDFGPGPERLRQLGGGASSISRPKPRMPGLPAGSGRTGARQIDQYPEGVPTGVRGSNAGASVPPDKKPIRDSYNSTGRQLQRTNATAAAGLHGVTNAPGQGPVQVNPAAQKAWETSAEFADAKAAGEAAAKARYEQKMGYLSRGAGLPATSDPQQDAYWARADMAMWAQNNKELAKRQGWVEGKDYKAATSTEVDPAQSYGVKLAQGAEAAAAPTSFALTPEQVQDASQFEVGQLNRPVDASTVFAEQSAPDMATQASFTPQELAQDQAAGVLNAFTSKIKASKEFKPEVGYEAEGVDFDEIDRNAYGTRFNTRQFF